MTYYVAENENIFHFLATKNIQLTEAIRKRLEFISQKTYNNYIGYYQFRQESGEYIKFLIVPKIHKNIANEDKEQAFFRFLSKYYELSERYEAIKHEQIDGNILDISFADFQQQASGTLDDFLRYKYIYALQILERFFKKHNKTQSKTTGYISQSVANKIDIKNNIRSLNKANVHQIKKEIEPFSVIAMITEQVLMQFKANKIEHIEAQREDLLSKTHAILNSIKKRFKQKESFSFKDRDIITNRIIKLFKGSRELKNVYEALLSLIGLEHFDHQDSSQTIEKLDNMIALFFNPAQLFEWVVFDYLTKKHQNGEILADSQGKATSKEYALISSQREIKKLSNPDFIVIENELVTIIDAKWKVLERIEDLKFDDIAKLERDWRIRKEDYDAPIQNILIYPKIDFDFEKENPFKHNYSADFEFEISSIPSFS
jgi:hypothetical protein